MKVKSESEVTQSWASSPITSWQIDGETVETMSDFIFLGSKITADGGGSHEMKKKKTQCEYTSGISGF